MKKRSLLLTPSIVSTLLGLFICVVLFLYQGEIKAFLFSQNVDAANVKIIFMMMMLYLLYSVASGIFTIYYIASNEAHKKNRNQ